MLKLFLFLLLSISLYAYDDYDMDGVEDRDDKCPNTLLSELVDANGCPTQNLESYHHFDIIYGFNFYQTNYDSLEEANTLSSSLQLDYYYKDFSLQLSSSYYDSSSATFNNSGADDSFLGAYYNINEIKNLTITLGIGAIISTYDSELNNNNTDYISSLNISYMYKNLNFFSGYSYTVINDDDIVDEGIEYRDTNSYSLGLGYYPSQKLYISSSYGSSDSIYKEIDTINTLSFYTLYTINENWFTNITYAYGLSDSASDNFASLRVGYYF